MKLIMQLSPASSCIMYTTFIMYIYTKCHVPVSTSALVTDIKLAAKYVQISCICHSV